MRALCAAFGLRKGGGGGQEDPDWGQGLGEELLAMAHVPPVIAVEQPDGRTRRTIGVVLVPPDGRGRFRVASVDIFRREITEVEPRGGENGQCGFTPAGQATTRNTPGQAWVSVWQGGTRLWRMLVKRPAGSSGRVCHSLSSTPHS